MGERIVILFLIFYSFLLGGCSKKNNWMGVFYIEGNLQNETISSPMSSLEECRDWVDEQSQVYGSSNYDYECGRDCELSESGTIYHCEETTE